MRDGYFLLLRQLESTDYSELTSCKLTPLILALKDLLENHNDSNLSPQEKAWVERRRNNVVIYIERLADGTYRDFLLENNEAPRYRFFETYADGFNGATDLCGYNSGYVPRVVENFVALHTVDPTMRGFPADSITTVERYDFKSR